MLLERDLCGSRSSGVNYGGVRRQGRPLSQLPLSQRAQGLWARLTELTGTDGEYVQSGHLKIARSEADLASLESYRARTLDFGMMSVGSSPVSLTVSKPPPVSPGSPEASRMTSSPEPAYQT